MLPNLQSLPVGVQGNTRRPVEEVVYDYHNPPPDVDIVGPLGWRVGEFGPHLPGHIAPFPGDNVGPFIGASLNLDFVFRVRGDSRRHVVPDAASMYVSFLIGDDPQPVNYAHHFEHLDEQGACSRAAWRVRDSAYAVAAAAYNRSGFAREANREMVWEAEGRWVTRSKA